MDFSSSDSPVDGLGAGGGVSGRPAAAASAEGVPTAASGGGEDGRGAPTEGRQGHSVSAELGKGLGVGGDLPELELH